MRIEIWSDVFCPWCYIGKRRFDAALAAFPHRESVEVVWRGFELDPGAEREPGADLYDLLARKYGGGRARAKAMSEHVERVGAELGLTYNFERVRPTNSFDAHRLIHLAARHGLQDAAEERLFAAYFTEGEHLGDRETLVRLGTEIGLDAAETREALNGDAYGDAVRADERAAAELGISGVPFFVFNRKYGISGAQPVEAFLGALNQVWREEQPLVRLDPITVAAPAASTESGADDPACADGSCAIPGAVARAS